MPRERTGKRQKRQALSDQDLPAFDAVLHTEQTKEQLTHSDDRTHKGKKEQNVTSISAWLQTWLPIVFSGAILVVVIVQAYIYRKQWKVMDGQLIAMGEQAQTAKLQAETAADELHRSHRPWVALVDVPIIESALSFEKEGGQIEISYRIRNGSDSPALGVNTVQGLVISLEQAPDPAALRGELDRLANPDFISEITKGGILLLPQATTSGPPTQARIDVNALNTVRGKNISLFLTTCLPYRDEFGAIHKTSTVYRFVTEKRERNFRPSGVVVGRFEIFGIGYAD